MMNIAAVCIQKGGVGKTTLTINLGGALAAAGQRVLLIDLDPQGHLTEGVGMAELYLRDEPSLYQCLIANKGGKLSELIHRHSKDRFSVIPATYQLMLAEQALFMARNREHKLRALLSELHDQFDWVLIDCPPALGNLTDNALNAARQAIIPIQAEATSVRALELLFDQIESIERGLNVEIRVLAVIPNLVQDSVISKRILLQEVWAQGCSIFAFEPASSTQAHGKEEIVELYRQLAEQIMAKVQGGVHA